MRALPATLGASGSLVAAGVAMLLALSAGIGLHGWPDTTIPVSSSSLQVHEAAPATTKTTVAPSTPAPRKLVIAAQPRATAHGVTAAAVVSRAQAHRAPVAQLAPTSHAVGPRHTVGQVQRGPQTVVARPNTSPQAVGSEWSKALTPPAPAKPSVPAPSTVTSTASQTAATATQAPAAVAPQTPAGPSNAIANAVNQAAAAAAAAAQQTISHVLPQSATDAAAGIGQLAGSAVDNAVGAVTPSDGP